MQNISRVCVYVRYGGRYGQHREPLTLKIKLYGVSIKFTVLGV